MVVHQVGDGTYYRGRVLALIRVLAGPGLGTLAGLGYPG